MIAPAPAIVRAVAAVPPPCPAPPETGLAAATSRFLVRAVNVGPPTRRSRGDERHGGRRNPQARGDALGVSPALVAAPCIEAGRKMWLLVVAGAASHAGAVRDDEELTQFVGDDGRRKGEQTENGAGYEHGEDEQ